ncbi:hypothetical protein E8E14_005059 [Neopestalotiopsis sp. 37M]|nr:hypothetical protein E8E14_005059 [Neopestalotiopsis sp. 37M]
MENNWNQIGAPLSPKLLYGSVLAIGAALLGVVVYRLWFHPLAGVPGPFLQRISGLPRIWQCRRGNRHICEIEAHRKYGSVVRLGPDSLSFDTLSALQTIHTKSANLFKGDEFYGLLDGGPEGGKSLQMTQDNEEHAARRKILDRMMPSRERVFLIINSLAKQFASTAWDEATENDSLLDINKVGSWYGFDVISTIAFGKPMDMLHSPEYRWLPKGLQYASTFLYWAGFARHLRLMQWFMGSKWPSRLGMVDAINAQRYQDLAESQVNKRVERMADEKGEGNNGPDDLFGRLIQANLYSDIDLRADSSLLIAAGSDALRLTIGATLFYWGRHPEAFAKAKHEVRSCVDDPDRITDATLSSLRYLRACLDETMRLTPPLAGSVPREVDQGGIVVDGIPVPAGMSVGTSSYAMHRNPAIFPRPDEFVPERWLERPIDPKTIAAFNPFLKGPRACPGKMIAYLAMHAALFHLIYKYDVVVNDDSTEHKKTMAKLGYIGTRGDEYAVHDCILGYAEGPMIELRPRIL